MSLDAAGQALAEKYQSMATTAAWKFYERTPVRELDELCAVAFEGLCAAVERWPRYCEAHGYDHRNHDYLVAYISRRVNGSLLDWSRSEDFLTREQRHRVKELERAQDELRNYDGQAVALAASRLGVPVSAVQAAQAANAAGRPLALDEGPPSLEGDHWADNVADPADNVEAEAAVHGILGAFTGALGALDQTAQDLITFIYFYEMKPRAAGELLSLDPKTAERLHEHAILTLHGVLLRAAGAGSQPGRPPPQPVEITVRRHDADFGYTTEAGKHGVRRVECPVCHLEFWTVHPLARFCCESHQVEWNSRARYPEARARELSAARP